MNSSISKLAGGLAAAGLLAVQLISLDAQGPQGGSPIVGGPLAPDKPIAKGYNDAAKALADVDDNPMIKWAYNIWCATGYRHAGPNDKVDALADPDDWVSPKGFMTERAPKPAFGKFMDNAWYLGNEHTGAVVVKVPEGLLLFDTMSNPGNFNDLMLPQMKKFGLDPADIKYVFMGHQHGDHIGSANLIRAEYAPGALFVMGGPDADGVAASRASLLKGEAPARGGGAPTKLTPQQQRERLMLFPDRIDFRVDAFPGMTTGMRKIKIGESTTVTAILNPGHTVGQMSVIVPNITWKGQPHKLIVFSGNDQFSQARQYAISMEFLRSIVKQEGADTWINTHGYQGHAYQWVRKVDANPNMVNPFIMGEEGLDRFYGIMADCQNALERRAKDGTWRGM